jgi:hypothetical protein
VQRKCRRDRGKRRLGRGNCRRVSGKRGPGSGNGRRVSGKGRRVEFGRRKCFVGRDAVGFSGARAEAPRWGSGRKNSVSGWRGSRPLGRQHPTLRCAQHCAERDRCRVQRCLPAVGCAERDRCRVRRCLPAVGSTSKGIVRACTSRRDLPGNSRRCRGDEKALISAVADPGGQR